MSRRDEFGLRRECDFLVALSWFSCGDNTLVLASRRDSAESQALDHDTYRIMSLSPSLRRLLRRLPTYHGLCR